MERQTQHELLQKLLVSAGIVINQLDIAHEMLEQLENVINQGRPKFASKKLWGKIVNSRDVLKSKLNKL